MILELLLADSESQKTEGAAPETRGRQATLNLN